MIGREETDVLDFGDVDNSMESEGALTPEIDTDVHEMEEESSDILQGLSGLLHYCVCGYNGYDQMSIIIIIQRTAATWV